MRGGRVIGVGLGIIAILWTCTASRALANPPIEYKIKAAYVSKLVRFVEWPETNAIDKQLVIGVAGGGEFQAAMAGLEGNRFGDTRIRVLAVEDPDRLDGIHVLVVGQFRSATRAAAYLRAARDRPILTIGDASSFTRDGGIIQFVVVEDSIKFAINVEAAEQVGIVLSSRLLRLATNLRNAGG